MSPTATDRSVSYALRDDGAYLITEYNRAKPFASFLPGIAGLDGIPMWVFYVNRGQGVCSAGIQDKDHAVLEFLPANRAFQLAASQGFRTFVKLGADAEIPHYEPFQDHDRDRDLGRQQRMVIEPTKLTFEETNTTLGLTFSASFFNVVEQPFAGLARILRIRNDRDAPATLEVLDGMPLLVPAGVTNPDLQLTRRLTEAFVEVVNHEARAPLFRAKVEPVDRPEVVRVVRGNFYVGFTEGAEGSELVTPFVDPVAVFGTRTDYSFPEALLEDAPPTTAQVLENRLPCAMGRIRITLDPGESATYTSVAGHADSVDELNSVIVPRILSPGFATTMEVRGRSLVDRLTQPGLLVTSEPVLDRYARQNYLDNGLRGGFPVTLEGGEGTALHLYSRKHGDLERDYNHFHLEPSPYSQGNGNFRDVNQNRRSDLLVNPDVGSDNVVHFSSLIQLDGFNPLVIKQTRLRVREGEREALRAVLAAHLDAGGGAEATEEVEAFLGEPFTPGGLVRHCKTKGIGIRGKTETLVGGLLRLCDKVPDADFGEGYWTDHWTYNLDLVENYLAVYPERLRELLFERADLPFWDPDHRVLPREEKYVLWEGRPMQLGAVVPDEEKAARGPNDWARVIGPSGEPGAVYRTTLVVKLVSLLANKVASLDPAGAGIEMDSDKPNWYDALNGLPALLGSSASETLETLRTSRFLLDALLAHTRPDETWPVYEELAELLEALQPLLEADLTPYDYWDRATTAKERYRARTRAGVSGGETHLTSERLRSFLRAAIGRLEGAVADAWDPGAGLPSTYFRHAVTEHEVLTGAGPDGEPRPLRTRAGLVRFRAKAFERTRLPLFLEGIVHWLRTRPDRAEAKRAVAAVRASGLYDAALGLYKVNAPLESEPYEIGRARIFSPGWFENESVWLHMAYKYLLELARNELYEELYEDFRTCLVPFFDPATYGRSVLENASFIVSSANPDPSLHGTGFVARLSGATAEFIHLTALLTIGPRPFAVGESGELELRLRPALPGWLFTDGPREQRWHRDGREETIALPASTVSFAFLGEILVTYHNPGRGDAFGEGGVRPVSWRVQGDEGEPVVVEGDVLRGALAERVRRREVRRIDIELA
jgi:hypothetical protein